MSMACMPGKYFYPARIRYWVLFRVSIHHDGIPAGNVEVLAKFTAGDDFTFDGAGNTYVARGRLDLIRKITPAGKVASLGYEIQMRWYSLRGIQERNLGGRRVIGGCCMLRRMVGTLG
jgi:hypothetical protein